MEKLPADPTDPGELFPLAETAIERLRSLIYRVRGRLALLAERAERDVAGLEPLPEPEDAPSSPAGAAS